jgi:hypothetical protein
VLRDSSAYYLLGYNSTTTSPDGKFHQIRVRVRRAGVQVRARNGYWALPPEEAARAAAPPKPGPPPAVTAALAAITPPSRDRFVRTWIGTDRGEQGLTRITFLWEPAASAPGTVGRGDEQPVNVSLIAAGPDGTPYFRGRLPAADRRVTFEAPPGALQMRLSIENAASDVLDTEMQRLDVPDLAAPVVALGTPALFRARTVREFEALKQNPSAVPAVGREFVRTERVLIRVRAYGPGDAPPAVSARLLNRAGDAMRELAVTAGPDAAAAIELPLAGLATGDYLVEIAAAGASGAHVRQLIGFRVAG